MALGEILTGAGSLFGSIGNALWGQAQSKDLMRYQAALNQQAVDRQNVYNSPAQQMERLRQAGLNPNLVYGNGVDGNQSSAPNVGMANRDPRFDSGLMDAVNTFFKRRQLENETNVSNANSQLALANSALAQSKNIQAMQQIALTDKTFNFQVDKAKADLDHTLQSIRESHSRESLNVSNVSLNASRANEIQENIKLIQAKIATELIRPDELRAKIYEMETRGDLNQAQIGVARSLEALNNEKISQVIAIVHGLNLDNGLKAIEYELTESLQRAGVHGFTKKDVLDLLKMLIKGLLD